MLYSIEKTLVLENIHHGIIFTTYQMYCLHGNFPVMKFSLLGIAKQDFCNYRIYPNKAGLMFIRIKQGL